mmetsp:Transcript_36992/g.56691  ORF Transcript_36992/g.56691 Transcript_36992/m.56691 type:complete len:102 (+) Transcript_36992:592-897(+)
MFAEAPDYYYGDYRRGEYEGRYSDSKHYDYYAENYYEDKPQQKHRKKKNDHYEDELVRDFEAGTSDVEDPEVNPNQQKAQDELYKQYMKDNRQGNYEEEED